MTTPTEPTAGAPVWTPPLSSSDTASASEDAAAASAAQAPAASAAPAESAPVRARRAGPVMGLLAIAAIIGAGGAGFAVGRATATGQTGTSQTVDRPGQNGNVQFVPGADASGLPFNPGNGGPGDRGGRPGAVTGTVQSVGTSSISVKLANGTVLEIPTSSSTTYHQQDSTTSAAVAAGQTVSITIAAPGRLGGGNPAASPGVIGGTPAAADVTITSK
jgi:hypothetical protein